MSINNFWLRVILFYATLGRFLRSFIIAEWNNSRMADVSFIDATLVPIIVIVVSFIGLSAVKYSNGFRWKLLPVR